MQPSICPSSSSATTPGRFCAPAWRPLPSALATIVAGRPATHHRDHRRGQWLGRRQPEMVRSRLPRRTPDRERQRRLRRRQQQGHRRRRAVATSCCSTRTQRCRTMPWAHLVRFMDDHPRAGAAGGRLLNPDGSFQHSAFRFPTLWMSFFDFFHINHRLLNSRLNGRYPLSAYDRSVSDRSSAGRMPARAPRRHRRRWACWIKSFFMYCEEIDWCLRIKQCRLGDLARGRCPSHPSRGAEHQPVPPSHVR